MLLHDKTAVITGNPYGIGRATARLFAAEGAKVVCIDDSDEGWTPAGGEARDTPRLFADVSDAGQVAAIVPRCERILGQVDILFNLAGRAEGQRFETTTLETWQRMVGRNLTAAFVCSQAFLPLMKRRPGGAIIHHGSIDGILGNPALAAYSAAKGGLVALTHVMAHDLAPYGIRVNCISTGAIRDGVARPKDAGLVGLTPAGRTGTPDDVARVALFLASEWSAYVNGANIVVDGGRTGITQGCYGS
ncbi:SDR family oxidoreductase [Pigmentiphaga soli]